MKYQKPSYKWIVALSLGTMNEQNTEYEVKTQKKKNWIMKNGLIFLTFSIVIII